MQMLFQSSLAWWGCRAQEGAPGRVGCEDCGPCGPRHGTRFRNSWRSRQTIFRLLVALRVTVHLAAAAARQSAEDLEGAGADCTSSCPRRGVDTRDIFLRKNAAKAILADLVLPMSKLQVLRLSQRAAKNQIGGGNVQPLDLALGRGDLRLAWAGLGMGVRRTILRLDGIQLVEPRLSPADRRGPFKRRERSSGLDLDGFRQVDELLLRGLQGIEVASGL
mmetsp:Transcript_36129/g.86556  ORF Transcript_36129/g.86556 Transcript_36129/m.86556 type:complete len:220 (+) Transcript_36129:1264-1923(+)